MAREYSRQQRVAEQIRRELAVLIQQEVRDPRVGMATVSAVEISRDLSCAKIFVTILDTQEDPEKRQVSLNILNNSTRFLRGQLGRRMQLRTVPSIRFFCDQSLQRGNYLSYLIDQACTKGARPRLLSSTVPVSPFVQP